MSYAPELRTEAYELYLAGRAPDEIARELKRRHSDAETPTAKTVEKWAYVHAPDGKTWSDKRYEAEAAARDAVTSNFVGAKGRLMTGLMDIQAKLQERVAKAVEGADTGPLSQELYAYINATKSLTKMLDSRLAEEARAQDAVDLLVEAMRRVVPGFEMLEPKVKQEFQRLVAMKAAAPAAATP
jgi:hypothetical protein